MTGKKTQLHSHRKTSLIVFFCALAILVATTFVSLHFSFAAEKRSHERLTLSSTQQINEKVTLAVGTLYSMVTTHQASDSGFDNRQFEMFANNLIQNQLSVTAAGRYDQVLHEDLKYYTEEQQVHGVFSFAPKKLTENGDLVATEQKPYYTAMISFFPQNPVTAGFVGLDLSDDIHSKSAIYRSVRNSAPFSATTPDVWVSDGELNVFASSYYGHYVPETEEDRELQTDGGYFITLDLSGITTQSTEAMFPLSVEIAMNSTDNGVLVEQAQKLVEERFASEIFSARTIEHNLVIGAESATIVYETPAGVTKSQIFSALLNGLAALFLFGVFYAALAVQHATREQIKANERALARERERALVTLNSLQDAVITTDSEDKIDYLNPAVLQVLKTNREELLGLPLQEVLQRYFSEEHIPKPGTIDKKNYQNIENLTSLMRLNKDGSRDAQQGYDSESTVFNCNSSSIVNSDNDKIGVVLTMRNISKEHALTTELAHQATHDALTGLPNRRQFESILGDLLNSDPEQIQPVVGYIDLDQFKLINDTVGHAAGDELLKNLAVDLQAFVPESMDIARLGGDEFGFICKDINQTGADTIAKTFYDFFQSYTYHTEKHVFAIRASIGISTLKPYHLTINDILSEVDIACYTAKDMGRNGYVIYDAEDKDTKDREGEMLYLPLLQSALKENRFVLYTQPIVSTARDATDTHHYECLIRMFDEDGTVITPYKFIVAAERYDLITDIDRWVIQSALSQISEFRGTELEDTIFSINLSGQSAVDTTMPGFIDEMLQKYRIDAAKICFELTETAVVSNLTQAQKLITLLRDRGCTIALDDFGAGASSFGYLKNLEVDYLKIDGQFVKEINSNKVDLEMVRSMKNVGDALGIKTIAEFVESEEVLQALREIKVDYAQGYHVGKPSLMSDLFDNSVKRRAA